MDEEYSCLNCAVNLGTVMLKDEELHLHLTHNEHSRCYSIVLRHINIDSVI